MTFLEDFVFKTNIRCCRTFPANFIFTNINSVMFMLLPDASIRLSCLDFWIFPSKPNFCKEPMSIREQLAPVPNNAFVVESENEIFTTAEKRSLELFRLLINCVS